MDNSDCLKTIYRLEIPCTLIACVILSTYFLLIDRPVDEEGMCPRDFSDFNFTDKFYNRSFLLFAELTTFLPKSTSDIEEVFGECFCNSNSCIRKCCDEGKRFASRRNLTCVFQEEDNPMVDMEVFNNNETTPISFTDHMVILHDFSCNYCEDICLKVINDTYLQSDGTLILETGKTLTYDEFCFEKFLGDESLQTLICTGHHKVNILMYIRGLGELISSVFYLLVFIIYACVQSLKGSFNGKAVMSYTFCLAFDGISNIVFYGITPQYYVNESSIISLACLCLINYGDVASYTWLTVMCFDVWRTFRQLKPVRGAGDAPQRHKYYAWFAWLAPGANFLLTITLSKCLGLSITRVSMVCLYLPIQLSFLVNAAMFLTTWCRLRTLEHAARALQQGDSRVSEHRRRYKMFINLFFIMAAPWAVKLCVLMDSVSPGKTLLSALIGVVTALQGLLVFCIFVCDSRVLRVLCHRARPTTTSTARNASQQTTTTHQQSRDSQRSS